ncbi:hypothetical protein [Cellulosilyticum sp. I15G10I2]|uniref:hypothetical protein n=1 Tax=Cellulosilyticum sp. I15G10I2 TaxID=1892843 RepID=UPI00085C9327|nr:hypothetical protein [Cellulosilyticum sp. I15G10I2]
MIIPYITNSGIISRSYINKVSQKDVDFRVNSQFRKSLIVIGNQVFLLSFSAKYSKSDGLRSHFECCMQIDVTEVVSKILDHFNEKWQQSVPLVN